MSQGLVDTVAASFYDAVVKPTFSKDAKKLVVQCVEAVTAPDTTILVCADTLLPLLLIPCLYSCYSFVCLCSGLFIPEF